MLMLLAGLNDIKIPVRQYILLRYVLCVSRKTRFVCGSHNQLMDLDRHTLCSKHHL